VRDHSGHIVAALGATVTASHIEESRMDEMVQRVRVTADEISGLLNYSPARTAKVVPLHAA
jgi:DNA-binding IclR family transcriptional regulator